MHQCTYPHVGKQLKKNQQNVIPSKFFLIFKKTTIKLELKNHDAELTNIADNLIFLDFQ